MQRWEKLYGIIVITIIIFATYSAGFLKPQNLELLFGKMEPYGFYSDAQATNWWDTDNYAVPSPTITIPPSESHLAIDGGYKTAGTSGYTSSSGGTYNDTHADDGVTFWAEAGYEGTDSNAWTEAWIWVNITDINLATVRVQWDISYQGGALIREIKIITRDSAGGIIGTHYPSFTTTGYLRISEATTIYQLDFIVHIKTDAVYIEGAYYSVSKAEIDYVCVSPPSDTAFVDPDTRYIGTIAGTASKIMGYLPLFGNYYEAYGYWVNITFADWWTGSDSVTLSFSPSSQTSLDNTIADFCFFIYMVPSSSIVSILQIKIRYQFNTLSVVYMIQRSSTESLEIDVSGSEYFAKLYTSIFPRWVGLKDFNNLQLMDIIKEAGGSADPSNEKLQRIDIEVTVNKGSSTDPATIITIWDWFGSWEPASEIQYMSMQVNYRIQSGGLDKLGIVALPAINYGEDAYRFVYFFYDTSTSAFSAISTSGAYDANGDEVINGWDVVYIFYQELEKVLLQLGYVVTWVDVNEIKTIVSTRTDVVIVIGNGVFPYTIYYPSKSVYLIRDFIRGGGRLVWLGDWIGFYGMDENGNRYTIGVAGDDYVLGANILGGETVVGYGSWSPELSEGRLYENNTELGEGLGLDDVYFYRGVCIEYYEENEGGDYVLLRIFNRTSYAYSDGKPIGQYSFGYGWFQFGNGYVLIYPYGYDTGTAKTVAKRVARAFLVMPKGKNTFSYRYYDPEYIKGDAYYIDIWEDTVMPEEETDESGINGYGENFADIADWTTLAYKAFNYYASTDGDIATIYSEFSETEPRAYYRISVSLNNVSASTYPFLEIRWRGETNESTYMIVSVDFYADNTRYYSLWLLVHTVTFDWTVERINVFERLKSYTSATTYKICQINIILKENPNGVNQYGKLWIDWVRLFRPETMGWINNQLTDKSSGVIYSDYGSLHISAHFSSSHTGYIGWVKDIADVSTSGLYVECRGKVSDSNVAFRLSFKIDGVWHNVGWTSSTEYVVIRSDLSQYGNTLEIIAIDLYVIGSPADGTYYADIDYIKIGTKGSWRPIYEAPLGKLYSSPARIISDQITIDKLRFSEKLDYGVLNIKIGVLTIAWGTESVSGDLIITTKYYESQELTIIHTYTMYYALKIKNTRIPYDPEKVVLPLVALGTSIILTLRKQDREKVLIIRILGIIIAIISVII